MQYASQSMIQVVECVNALVTKVCKCKCGGGGPDQVLNMKIKSRPRKVKSCCSIPTFPSVRWSLRKEQKDVWLVVHHLLLVVHQDVVHHLLLGDHHLCLRATLATLWHQLLCDTIM